MLFQNKERGQPENQPCQNIVSHTYSNDATNTPSYKFSTTSEDEDPFEDNSDLDPNFELRDDDKTITEGDMKMIW
ncbi:unnamed protein product [Acanthoscelides obtectus]|uniref:Uncharacterized protein n=1 Tax=Acanthoscelides obtectus TaxID=200917 RepID=A0A9P0Q0T1_ACAOB|nr:unnamed protein product [Acanthoscelides obtectus]CAK1656602.1 hypothetical protein AOBTE_LOCUS19822 [Acanthoscelides obtectus]